MTFNYTTLITDRTQSDVDRVKYLAQRITKGTATDAERAEYLTDLKGAYNASDLNRVTSAMEYLKRLYDHYGYHVNYTPIYIERKKKSRLPAGYTEVEYIQSSGTQYVDTGFQPNQDTKVLMEADYTPAASGSSYLFGGSVGSRSKAFEFCGYSGRYRIVYNGTETYFTETAFEQPITVAMDKNEATVNSAETVSATYATFASGYNMYLFATNRAGTAYGTYGAKIYSAKIYDNGVLIRDYVPCINADNAVGLYDLVNGQFYGNAGTGTFTAGDVVESAPDSDTEELDPYTWYVSDIPTQAQMQTYLQNVVVLKSKTHEILSYYDAESQYPLPDAPTDMVKLTYQEANDIEQILQSIENQLIYMSNHFYWYYSGEVYAGEI